MKAEELKAEHEVLAALRKELGDRGPTAPSLPFYLKLREVQVLNGPSMLHFGEGPMQIRFPVSREHAAQVAARLDTSKYVLEVRFQLSLWVE